MRGKNKCKILKQIRQKIADENDIPLVTRECTHQGECSGTCPKCEQELRYLEQQLARRQALGKRVTVTALAAGMLASLTGCPAPQTPEQPSSSSLSIYNVLPEGGEVVGILAELDPEEILPSEEPETEQITETEELFELAGDVVYIPEETDELSGALPVSSEESDG